MRKSALSVAVSLSLFSGISGPLLIASAQSTPQLVSPQGAFAGLASSSESESNNRSVVQLQLVTGDAVTFNRATKTFNFVAATGREDVSYFSKQTADGTYVIPLDAVSLVATGTLDEDFFNLELLSNFGLSDAATGDLPVIVKQNKNSISSTLNTVANGKIKQLDTISAIALTASSDGSFWDRVVVADANGRLVLAPGIDQIWLDRPVQRDPQEQAGKCADKVVADLRKQINAVDLPYTGAGVRVAVVDTGVLPSHKDLNARIFEMKDFTSSAATGLGIDDNGHGTHVAGIIAGSGELSGGKYRGLATDAELFSAKVLDSDGYGNQSDIILGAQWAVDSGAQVLNLSLGGGPSDGNSALDLAFNEIAENSDALIVVAAGNAGPTSYTVGNPGTADSVLTVGASDGTENVASFSSRGPRLSNNAVKPDLVAPGVGIVSARVPGTVTGDFTNHSTDGPIDDNYTALSGTSMATPVVAGASALLLEARPDLKGVELKNLLASTTDEIAGTSVFDQGLGELNLGRALTQEVSVNVANFSFPYDDWPRETTDQQTEVTYRNDSSETVTLNLDLETIDSDLDDPKAVNSADVLSLSTPNLTLAPGESESVQVHAHTPQDKFETIALARLVATDASSKVHLTTVLSANYQTQTQSFGAHIVNAPAGMDASQFTFMITSTDPDFGIQYFIPEAPDETVSLPKGNYSVTGMFEYVIDDSYAYAVLATREITIIEKDIDLAFDYNRLTTVGASVSGDDRTAPYSAYGVQNYFNTPDGEVSGTISVGSYEPINVITAPEESVVFETGILLTDVSEFVGQGETRVLATAGSVNGEGLHQEVSTTALAKRQFDLSPGFVNFWQDNDLAAYISLDAVGPVGMYPSFVLNYDAETTFVTNQAEGLEWFATIELDAPFDDGDLNDSDDPTDGDDTDSEASVGPKATNLSTLQSVHLNQSLQTQDASGETDILRIGDPVGGICADNEYMLYAPETSEFLTWPALCLDGGKTQLDIFDDNVAIATKIIGENGEIEEVEAGLGYFILDGAQQLSITHQVTMPDYLPIFKSASANYEIDLSDVKQPVVESDDLMIVPLQIPGVNFLQDLSSADTNEVNWSLSGTGFTAQSVELGLSQDDGANWLPVAAVIPGEGKLYEGTLDLGALKVSNVAKASFSARVEAKLDNLGGSQTFSFVSLASASANPVKTNPQEPTPQPSQSTDGSGDGSGDGNSNSGTKNNGSADADGPKQSNSSLAVTGFDLALLVGLAGALLAVGFLIRKGIFLRN